MINNNKSFIIGEIGINHNGDLRLAKKIILEAKNSGFNIVKFQKRNPDISTPNSKKDIMRNTPWGTISYLAYKKKIEFGEKQFQEISKYCKKIGIEWLGWCGPPTWWNGTVAQPFGVHTMCLGDLWA